MKKKNVRFLENGIVMGRKIIHLPPEIYISVYIFVHILQTYFIHLLAGFFLSFINLVSFIFLPAIRSVVKIPPSAHSL
jgi:hypothetical protein